jgi:hypothetical protein
VATYDSAWCLSKFNQLTGRPDTDEVTTASKYVRLAEAQNEVIADLVPRCPTAMHRTGGPTATTTSDGIVHTFGSDGQGHAMGPFGHVWIGRSTRDYPDNGLIEGEDFINEGTQIRMVNERVENTLYWTGVPTPTDISASQEPALRPAPIRILIPLKAAWNFGSEGGRDLGLADEMESRYMKELAKACLLLKTQFQGGGAVLFTGLDRAVLRQA